MWSSPRFLSITLLDRGKIMWYLGFFQCLDRFHGAGVGEGRSGDVYIFSFYIFSTCIRVRIICWCILCILKLFKKYKNNKINKYFSIFTCWLWICVCVWLMKRQFYSSTETDYYSTILLNGWINSLLLNYIYIYSAVVHWIHRTVCFQGWSTWWFIYTNWLYY